MSAALLQSDADTLDIDEFDEDEAAKRIKAIRDVAESLAAKAQRLKL
jgi:hypothetical protein